MPTPLPLKVDLPRQTLEEIPAERVSTRPEPEHAPEPVTAPRRPAAEKQATPQLSPTLPPTLSQKRAVEKAHAALTRHLIYPPEAIARGLEGEVILLLILDASGRVTSAEVARSSGHALLDQAALTAAQKIGALPGNPKQTLLPLRFRLD